VGRAGRVLLWPAALALLSACARAPQTALHPAGPVGQVELGLILRSFGIMIAVAAAVYVPLAVIVIRHRARPGRPRTVAQAEGHAGLEVLWTVAPFVLLLVLAVPTFRDTFWLSTPPRGSDPLAVTVVGHQWWWEFDYPAYGIVTADEMHVPVDRVVDITLRSADVIHSFWVPALGGKQDAIPGLDLHMWLEADRPGLFPGQCAEFCGLAHSQMRLDVVAESGAAFAAWAAGLQHPVVTPATPQAAEGQRLFLSLGCAACHTIDGTPARGTVGPNLTGLANRRVIVAGTLANDPADLGKWLHDPQRFIPGTVMPPFPNLTPSQLQDLTAYLEGLK
jgi:cytochrome c oxidase subunit 2